MTNNELLVLCSGSIYDVDNIVCFEDEPYFVQYHDKRQYGGIMFDIAGKTFRAYTDVRCTEKLECIRKKRISAAKASMLSNQELIDRGVILGTARLSRNDYIEVNEFLGKIWGRKEVLAIKVPEIIIEALLH